MRGKIFTFIHKFQNMEEGIFKVKTLRHRSFFFPFVCRIRVLDIVYIYYVALIYIVCGCIGRVKNNIVVDENEFGN